MPSNLLMPELSPGMEKGSLLKWHRKVGESFRVGDLLAEVETDKAIMEIAAEHDGALSSIVVPEGTADVPVHQLIAVLLAIGESAAAAVAAPAEYREPGTHAAMPAPILTRPQDGRIVASPAARRVARETGISLKGIKGSGPGGRIVQKDLQTATAQMQGSYDSIPHDEMRRTIAERLTLAVHTIPQISLTIDCEVDAALRLREEINSRAGAKEGARVSLTDLILKAYAMAFTLVPDANVSWTNSAMLRHKSVDVGLAVALPGNGLITPIIRDAQTKSLAAIGAESRDLATRARERKLKPQEFRGGTTALSNLGMVGVRQFSAIINPPHATILAVGAARETALVKNGALVVGTVLTVTLTCDHRAVDGALGAQLLKQFKQLIERPETLEA